ncbi:DsbA family protein [Patescibacteria group bacterium]
MKKIFLLSLAALLFMSGCNGGDDLNGHIDVPSDIDITYTKGNANASVTITEYSDYQCPFCARLTLEVLPLLQNDYIETGKVLFVFKDLPLPNHRDAQKASEATYCAGEQDEDKYWEMHVKLFENQKNLAREDLSTYAGDLELNVEAFDSCLDADKYKNLVLRNRQDGLKAGVEGTPTLFINDTPLVGLPQYDALKQVIETELRK